MSLTLVGRCIRVARPQGRLFRDLEKDARTTTSSGSSQMVRTRSMASVIVRPSQGRRRGKSSSDKRPQAAAAASNDSTSPEREDWKLHSHFPFMSPNFLWRVMGVAGFFVYAACTLSPPNPFTGGSQLNAALTLFQSILLWRAPESFGHEARRSLSLTCAVGYAASAGVTLSDVFFTRTTARLLIWSGSFLTFYLAAQANMVYLILDNQARSENPDLGVGILHEAFQFKEATKKRKYAPNGFKIVLKAFSRIFLITLVSFGAAMLGKYSRELVGLALFSAST